MDRELHVVCVQTGVLIAGLVRRNPNVSCVISGLHGLVECLTAVLDTPALTPAGIIQNGPLVIEVLDAAFDHGHVQLIGVEALRKSLAFRKDSVWQTPGLAEGLSVQITGMVSWRRPGLTYSQNRLYVDLVELVSATISANGELLQSEVRGRAEASCRLSGMPECRMGISDRLKAPGDEQPEQLNATYHQCVKLERLDSEQSVVFTPPDGKFTLMQYTIHRNMVLPFTMDVQYKGDFRKGSLEAELRICVRVSLHDAVVLVPVPPETIQASEPITSTTGSTRLDLGRHAVEWRVKRMTPQTIYAIRVVVNVETSDTLWPLPRPPVTFNFAVSSRTMSGFAIRYLKVHEASNYRAVKWVRMQSQVTCHRRFIVDVTRDV